MTNEYRQQLERLATTLTERFRPEVEQHELPLGDYAEISDVLRNCVIEKPIAAQLGRTAILSYGWDSEGNYLERN